MRLIKTILYTSVSQALSIAAGLISVKVITSQIGPVGMAYTGQFANATAILLLFATGAISSGVVKYLAQYSADKAYQLQIIRTSFWIIVFCSIIIGIATLLFSGFLSRSTFKTDTYTIVYIFWVIFLLFTTLSGLMGSILNGLREIRMLTLVSISGTLIGLTITIILAKTHGVTGVLIAPSLTAFCLFLIHLYFLYKYKWFKLGEVFAFKINRQIVKLLSSFFFMTVISGILTPAMQLFIRNKIILDIGLQDAGYWQAVTRISDYYLGFVTSVLAVYYLPRLSELTTRQEIRKEVINGYKVILPTVAVISFIIWLLRHFIIHLLMTKDFAPAEQLFGIQFLGDFFKIGAWLVGYLIVAKAMKSYYIINEIVFSIVYGFTTVFLIRKFGLMGTVYGFAICYLLDWIILYLLLVKKKVL